MEKIEPQHHLNIPIHIILTILTCGLFNIYWNYKQMQACNDLLERDEFIFWKWCLLIIITCGIYHIFYQYKMGSSIVEIQDDKGMPAFTNLPILSVAISILALPFVVDCIHQHEINKIVA